MRAFILVVAIVAFIAWCSTRIVLVLVFNANAQGYLERAANANTVEMAQKELSTALHYIEGEGMTAGYTSIIYRTPDEDVGFWYNNIRTADQELRQLSPKASSLETSNVLMKLRETLLDGKDGRVTVPKGISVYPYNLWFCLWGSISFIFIFPPLIYFDRRRY